MKNWLHTIIALALLALSSVSLRASTVYEYIYVSGGTLMITNSLTTTDIAFDLYNSDTSDWIAGGYIDAYGHYHYDTFGSIGVQFGGGDAIVENIPPGNYTVSIWGQGSYPPFYSLSYY